MFTHFSVSGILESIASPQLILPNGPEAATDDWMDKVFALAEFHPSFN